MQRKLKIRWRWQYLVGFGWWFRLIYFQKVYINVASDIKIYIIGTRHDKRISSGFMLKSHKQIFLCWCDETNFPNWVKLLNRVFLFFLWTLLMALNEMTLSKRQISLKNYSGSFLRGTVSSRYHALGRCST